MKKALLVLALLVTPATAQQEYHQLSREQWNAMIQALQNVPMSVASHQQVMQIVNGIQQQAAAEEAKRVKPSQPKSQIRE